MLSAAKDLKRRGTTLYKLISFDPRWASFERANRSRPSTTLLVSNLQGGDKT
jgi:hypothetical protein